MRPRSCLCAVIHVTSRFSLSICLARTYYPLSDRLRIPDSLQLEAVLQPRHPVCTRRRPHSNDQLVVPTCARSARSTLRVYESHARAARTTYGMYMCWPLPPPGTIVSTSSKRSDMTRSTARALIRCPRRRAATLRRGSMSDRTETVPTAAAICGTMMWG